jgi:hypothetical protein
MTRAQPRAEPGESGAGSSSPPTPGPAATPARSGPGGAAIVNHRPDGLPAPAKGGEPEHDRDGHRARRRDHGPGLRSAFASLAVPNFRLYLAGQSVSLPGTWMQVVAQSWLVLQLTGSGVALGLVAAAQFLPVLLFGPYGGLLADRAGKRRLLLATQTALGLLALVLGILTVTRLVRLWMVFVLAVAPGTVNSVHQPTRQTFVPEMVGRDRVQNAVSLNSVLTTRPARSVPRSAA